MRLYLLLTFILGFSVPVFAFDKDTYWYGYAWGGMSAACAAFKYQNFPEKDAKLLVETYLNTGQEHVKDKNLINSLRSAQYEGHFFKNCKNLIAE